MKIITSSHLRPHTAGILESFLEHAYNLRLFRDDTSTIIVTSLPVGDILQLQEPKYFLGTGRHESQWAGDISFAMLGGHVSDREITLSSGLLPLLDAGDTRIANCGFDVEKDLVERRFV